MRRFVGIGVGELMDEDTTVSDKDTGVPLNRSSQPPKPQRNKLTDNFNFSASTVENVDDWCNRVFKDFVISDSIVAAPNYSDKVADLAAILNQENCIMDRAQFKMNIPLLDDKGIANNPFEKDYKRILDCCDRWVEGYRNNPIFAIYRGSGGGKTRCCEKIRRKLLLKKDVLVVAITFNCKWNVGGANDSWGTDDSDLFYILSVISRIMSMLCNVDLKRIVGKMKSVPLPNIARSKSLI